mmetsp:Transcript_14796/g.22412  ORF Transcript_14796/g.22412 Transcript_14796/m.22412 type:complete len:323 (+) Transcript_14796:107-1075(+)|eukprot:CAMPEP_0203662246 /NCGR_PEP_ID=MMETSP0090-20130426/277_1 /ASSEMBLY_ACC=CAM_ASM_001088 /TAXON_ID=426623 /ORGANISM="Chaetoceros affinis, Strain CCMP159" /LENGTH=322 /DNA_ID=CAMNT_0050525007 /DNA_START=43 /DNA_END=1014 /DNA_ORIENTATION=-
MASKELSKDHSQQTFLTEKNENQPSLESTIKVVDIGVNLTHKSFKSNWRKFVRRAIEAGVETIILTGTSLESSRQCLDMAQQWYEETNQPNLFFTVGVHPHQAKTWSGDNIYSNINDDNDDERNSTSTQSSMEEMRRMLQHPLAVAVGECGLDFNRNFSSKSEQRRAFRYQLTLALELNMPLFLHEREAHEEFIQIIDEQLAEERELRGRDLSLPPAVVHCFTGVKKEALCYIDRGYYIGFTGTICKEERGRTLRDIIPELPLEKLMVETDAPFMGFKGRKPSEPADCVDVARKLSEVIKVPFSTVCKTTTMNAMECFGINK